MAFCFCSTTDWITLPLAEGNRANLRMRRRPFDRPQHANSPSEMGFGQPDAAGCLSRLGVRETPAH